jgi:hypothetical protein
LYEAVGQVGGGYKPASPRAGRERLTDFAVVGNSRERRLEKNKKRIITFFNGIRANRKE